MNSRDLSRRSPWLVVGLGWALFALVWLIEASEASAACLERARHELVLCVAPPDAWQFLVSIGAGLLVAVLAVKRGLVARR